MNIQVTPASVLESPILRKYRRQGIGERVACHIFDQFPGPWQVGQINQNPVAIAFWRKDIHHYTQGGFEEQLLDNEHWRGPVQAFLSAPPARQ